MENWEESIFCGGPQRQGKGQGGRSAPGWEDQQGRGAVGPCAHDQVLPVLASSQQSLPPVRSWAAAGHVRSKTRQFSVLGTFLPGTK